MSKHVLHLGQAIAQAVSGWLPTPAARVRSRVWTSVSPANLHFANCSAITLTYHLGLVQ
jgi:hypothetical protein